MNSHARPDAAAHLLSVAETHATRTFLVDAQSGTELTFGALDQAARRGASVLRARGLQKGDVVVVVGDNVLALAKLYFSALYAGVVVSPVNPASSPDELRHAATALAAKLVVAGKGHEALAAAGGVPVASLDDLDQASASAQPLAPSFSSGDDLIVVFTSGTTSRPKGVVHRVADLVDNARTWGEAVGVTPENRFYNWLSLTYLGGYYNLLLLPYVNGASVVLGKTFAPTGVAEAWKNVVEHGVNTLWLVPSIASMILRADRGETGAAYTKKNVRLSLCGTAPLTAETRRAFEERYGVTLLENFALSETLFLTQARPSDGSRADCGTLLPGVGVRLVDKHGKDVKPGEDGEVLVKTSALMRGYLADGGRVELTLTDGHFATGDVGRFEGDRLRITGRKKDLIIRGGVNVSPAAVEEVIATHPDVRDVAVVGVPHPVMGEDVVAVVCLKDGASFDKVRLELAELCGSRLSRAKQPASFVPLAELPRTTNGKVQKQKLRTFLAEGGKPVALADPAAPSLEFDVRVPDAVGARLAPSKVVADISEAMSIKYNTRVYELKAGGEDVIVLSLGEAFFDIPLFPFDDLPFPALYHYSHSRGIPELRQRLAEYFRDEYEASFDPQKEIIVTAGSKIAIYMALLSVLNPGDEVLIHDPAWVSYFEQVRLCYGVPVGVPYDEEVFGFEKYVTNRTKVIVINNPNNPRGRVYTLAELSHLHRLAQKHNLYVLSDEAYSDFLLDSQRFVSMANLDTQKSHTIVVNSISKNFGISGWRLGYVITNPALIDQMLKINQHIVTCPATILEYYIAKHFSEIIEITKPQMREVVERRARMGAYMESIGLSALPGDSTFYFFVSLGTTKLGSEAFCDRLLDEQKICAVPGIGYGLSCDRFIRVGVGSESEERIMKGLRAIKALIDQTS